jgi:hypothetical protein
MMIGIPEDATHSVVASHVNIFAVDRDCCDSRVDDMDKDNRDDFTFAKLSDLKVPVTLRMSAISCRIHSHRTALKSRG